MKLMLDTWLSLTAQVAGCGAITWHFNAVVRLEENNTWCDATPHGGDVSASGWSSSTALRVLEMFASEAEG